MEIAEYHGRDFYAVGARLRTAPNCSSAPTGASAAGETVRLGRAAAIACWSIGAAMSTGDASLSLRRRLRERGLDGGDAAGPAGVFFVLALFIYPFLYGLVLSFEPKEGGWLANYTKFFSDPFLYDTIWLTLQIAVPVTLLNAVLSVPVALRVRLMKRQKLLTTILVIPITLGTVMVAEGLLTYLGPRGWLNRVLLEFGLTDSPVRLVHNYWGVMLSLVISGFPFTFLLTLSYVTGIDPALEQAGAMLGARARQRFFRILLPLLAPGLAITLALAFVQAFTVFPSAVLLGAPAGPTRVISIVAVPGGVRAVRLLAGLGDRDADGGGAGGHHRGAAGRAHAGVPRPRQHRQGLSAMHRSLGERLWSIAVWAVVVFFVVNLLAMIGSVVVNSFGTRWFNTWLPAGFTPQLVHDGLGRVPAARHPAGDGARWWARWCCCPA